MSRTILETTITRRSALSGGVACVLGFVVPRRLFGSLILQGTAAMLTSECISTPMTPNLYAFPGAGHNTTAIAVTWREQALDAECDPRQYSRVRIHASLKTWEFDLSNQAPPKLQRSDDLSVFTGNVVSPLGVNDRLVTAVVMELPTRAIAQGGSAGIWAEHYKRGSRRRASTPPVGGVHGMAGYHAATTALGDLAI